MANEINHPSYYNNGEIEPIDFIESHHLNFCRGNVIKYTARAGKKEGQSEIKDLGKATWYLLREIEGVLKNNTSDGNEEISVLHDLYDYCKRLSDKYGNVAVINISEGGTCRIPMS